jgi:hypothetical protein
MAEWLDVLIGCFWVGSLASSSKNKLREKAREKADVEAAEAARVLFR